MYFFFLQNSTNISYGGFKIVFKSSKFCQNNLKSFQRQTWFGKGIHTLPALFVDNMETTDADTCTVKRMSRDLLLSRLRLLVSSSTWLLQA